MQTFSDRLQRARATLGLTREDAAEHFGVRATTIYRWEHAIHVPRGADVEARLRLLERRISRRA